MSGLLGKLAAKGGLRAGHFWRTSDDDRRRAIHTQQALLLLVLVVYVSGDGYNALNWRLVDWCLVTQGRVPDAQRCHEGLLRGICRANARKRVTSGPRLTTSNPFATLTGG